MGQTSQSGQLIFATQTAPEVPVSASVLATDGLGVRIRSGSLGGSRDLLVTDPEIGGGRDKSQAYLGAVSFTGELDMYVRFRAIAMFLANALGEKATIAVTGATGAYEHTITPSDGQIPFMTVYEEIGDAMERFIHSDVMVNTLHLEAEANGFLTCTVGLIGRLSTPNVADIDATALLDNTSLAVGTNIRLKYNSLDLPAKSFSLDINNNAEDDNHYMGSFFLGDITAKGRDVTASASMRHKDSKAMRQAMFGSPLATQIGGIPTKEKLEIIIESYEDIAGVTGTKYSLTIEVPKAVYEPFSLSPSGDDAFENDVSIRAIRPDSAEPILTAVVVNGSDTIE